MLVSLLGHAEGMSGRLPSGLVTFLFTDIEGSTRLFRRLGEGWPALLDRHHALARAAWAAHGGVEFNVEGDALLVAFGTASSAVAAAVDAQARLAEEPWPADAPVRVRMGLHSGIAYPRDGDYIALALHRAARVVGAANGGQIIASADAITAAGPVEGVHVERLGAYRLRDFDGVTDLFQVTSTDRAGDAFPALRAVPAEGHNIARPVDSFVGRVDELKELDALVEPDRLVTVCGPGGMGKTRFAMEFALESAGLWPDGVWMIDLVSVQRGESVGSAIAAAFGVAVVDQDALDAAVDHLRAASALVVLDNCEHVIDSAREAAHRLLAECRDVGLLATSRERLGVRGEHVYLLSPLAVAQPCVDLFVDRARERDASFVLGEDDAAVVLEICRRLDGMPLAIELAAARAHLLTPSEILESVQRALPSLGTRSGEFAERQRTVHALIEWSYNLLDEAEQAVLRSIAAFVASFDLRTAAVAVGDEVNADDVPEIVWSLVEKSLVNVERREGATRYRLLETIRAVATVYSERAGEAEGTRARLGAYYVQAFPLAKRGTREWRARMTLEYSTLIELADRLLGDDEVELALALGRLSHESMRGTGSSRAGTERAQRLIAACPRPTAGLARLHALVASMLAAGGELDAAARHLTSARELMELFGDHDLLGPIPLAQARTQLSLRLGTEAALAEGEHAAEAELMRPLPPEYRADILIELATLAGVTHHRSAHDLLREAAAIADEVDDHILRLVTLNNVAEHDLRAGDTRTAASNQLAAMHLAAELGVPLFIGFAFVLAARLAQPAGLDADTVRLHAAADVILDECAFELIPDDRALSDEVLDAARANLGARFDVENAAGRALALTEALSVAEQVFAAVTQPSGSSTTT